MATNLFKGLKPSPKRGKSGFDLSQKHVFSSKPGELRPVMCLETVPADYFEIDTVGLTRTMTMQTAPFIRGKMHYDFFFVPYSQIWHNFNQFITQRTDKHSSNQKFANFVPSINLGTLIKALYTQGNNVMFSDIHNQSWYYGAMILLDMCGYGNFSDLKYIESLEDIDSYIEQYKLNDKYVNIFRLAAYQHIWYDFYRNKYFDEMRETSDYRLTDYVRAFNFDDLSCQTFADSHLPAESYQDLIRVCGLTTLRYRQWKKDIFTSAMPSTQFGPVSSVQLGSSSVDELMEHRHAVSIDGETSVDNLWTFNGGGNFDTADTDVVMRQYGPPTTGKPFSGRGGGLSPAPLNHNHDFEINNVTETGNYEGAISLGAFDVLNLRKAEMLQAWRQAALRAGNMTDDSMRAHYGVEPYYEGDENVNYLGSFTAALNVDPVAATSQNGDGANQSLGDLAANGKIVMQGNKIKFKCKDFGVIMCLNSFVPDAEYNAYMMDKANTLFEPFDFFTPEFENIGLEPLPTSEYNLWATNIYSSQDNDILGYVPRYHQYKTAVDKVHGEFCSKSYGHAEDVGHSMSHWVAPRIEDIGRGTGGHAYMRAISTFYISPKVYDTVMAVESDDTQLTDTFVNNVFFDVKAIRPMTVLGLPQF